MDGILYFDISALIILIILLYSVFSRKAVQGRTNLYFVIMLFANAIAAIFDIWFDAYGLWFPYGPHTRSILVFLSYAYFVVHNGSALIYMLYIIHLTDRWYKFRENFLFQLLLYAPYIITIATLISNAFTHGVFYVDETCTYVRESHITILYACAAAYMIFGIIYLLVHRKLFFKELFIPLMSMFPLELAAVIIQYFHPELFIEIFIIVVANTFIMINIQRPEENMDRNLGIRNYYAYTTDLKKSIANQKKMGIIFIKIVNYRSVYSILHYDAYNDFLKKVHQKITAFLLKEKKFANLYYIESGRFALVLDNYKEEDIATITNGLANLLTTQVSMDSLYIPLEPSVCYLRYPEDLDNFKSIISFSEKYYRLVENPVGVIYASNINSRDFHLNNDIDAIIHNALQEKKFELYYQPIYSVEKRKFISAEALIRLNDEKYGFISPQLLISAAEQNGTIHEIGDFVLDSVCELIESDVFKETGLEYVELNVSAVEYMQVNLAERILNIISKHNVSMDQLNLEITETAFVSSQNTVMENLNKLSKAGLTFSLDDYGTGYSNIQRVVTMPLKIVKIDKSFVDEIANERMFSVIKNTINMLKDMNVEILVEGIETKELAEQFEAFKCQFIQGYYFSKPLPKQQFIEFCKEHYQTD